MPSALVWSKPPPKVIGFAHPCSGSHSRDLKAAWAPVSDHATRQGSRHMRHMTATRCSKLQCCRLSTTQNR